MAGEVCLEHRKRMIDMCCLQEVRRREQGNRMLGMNGRRCKLWWSGKGIGVGGVGVMVEGDLCEQVVEERSSIDRMMTLVVFLMRMC